MKIFTVIGARPQFIKAAVVSRAFAEHQPDVREILVHTGQHYDTNMSDVFFEELDIPRPSHNLGIGGGTHGQNTGRMIEQLEALMLTEKPDWVLVYGDTDSTLAGALAASKLHIPVAHVEAGLRSFNRSMPEEINRVLTDHVSTLLFAPTALAISNLCNEGIADQKMHMVGDVMYDAALHYGKSIQTNTGLTAQLNLQPKTYVLATIHRAENTDNADRLATIVDALETTARQLPVVWPLHPRTRAVLQKIGRLERLAQSVHLINPVGYLEMVQLEKFAAVIATDSGGVQKEAFFHQVPCVTLRNETEWVELVQAGWNRLAPPVHADSVVQSIADALNSKGINISPYGAGDAAERIVSCLTGYNQRY